MCIYYCSAHWNYNINEKVYKELRLLDLFFCAGRHPPPPAPPPTSPLPPLSRCRSEAQHRPEAARSGTLAWLLLLPLFRQQTLRASLMRAHCALGRELGAGAVRVHSPHPHDPRCCYSILITYRKMKQEKREK